MAYAKLFKDVELKNVKKICNSYKTTYTSILALSGKEEATWYANICQRLKSDLYDYMAKLTTHDEWKGIIKWANDLPKTDKNLKLVGHIEDIYREVQTGIPHLLNLQHKCMHNFIGLEPPAGDAGIGGAPCFLSLNSLLGKKLAPPNSLWFY